MKLVPILAQYLYTNKKLHLAGLGTFFLDTSPNTVDSGNKQNKINFLQDSSSQGDDESLISFIASQTGKMKTLAASDLSSFLELTIQFLNIGKPFKLEGIGTLIKNKAGYFDFTSGNLSNEKNKETAKELSATSSTEESFTGYNNIFSKSRAKALWKKPILIFLLIAGIGVAIWGGNIIYKKSQLSADTLKSEMLPVKTAVKDTVTKDTTTLAKPAYKFVLEIAKRKRALERFAALRSYNWNVQLETKDSTQYKLVMLLPVMAQDTLRVRDSLSLLTGRKVFIEN